MTNLKKSSPECFGTPENRPGWAGFDGLDGEVAAELANGGPNSIRIANDSLWLGMSLASRGVLRV